MKKTKYVNVISVNNSYPINIPCQILKKKHFKRKHPSVNICPDIINVNNNKPSTSSDNSFKRPLSQDVETEDTNQPSPKKNKVDTIISSTKFDNMPKQMVQEKMSNYIHRKITGTAKKKIDASLLELFILDYQPFSIAEDRGLKNFVRSLNPSYELPNRHTISNSHIPLKYETCLREAKEKMKNITNICITTDCWTSRKTESFGRDISLSMTTIK